MKPAKITVMKPRTRVPNLYINVFRAEQVDVVFSDQSMLNHVYQNAFEAIQTAHQKKKIVAPLFEVNFSGKSSSIPREKWQVALQNAILFYETLEAYEECVKFRDLSINIDNNSH